MTRKKVRIATIGVGGMGGTHSRYLGAGDIRGASLVAVCDSNREIADRVAGELSCKPFYSTDDLFASGMVEAVLIATPHYSHTTIGIDALKAGMHVLVEKPISVHKKDCERLIAAHRRRGKQVFSAMFNQRTDPRYRAVKKLIETGRLGRITRVNWINTHWFRTEAYYSSGTWRATWAGEGGGVLLNQAPHELDLLQWLCGVPKRVHGFCSLGKWHDIEVEDEVTAYLEFPGGASGIFITSTGEAPGTNRLEICGEHGRIVLGEGPLTFIRCKVPMTRFSRTCKQRFAKPPTEEVGVRLLGKGGQHRAITQNFVDAIRKGTPLIAPAEEGIRSVELANAILFSSLTGKPVDLPLDSDVFERKLKRLIRGSTRKKKAAGSTSKEDLAGSFS